jgi:hypothetical protein
MLDVGGIEFLRTWLVRIQYADDLEFVRSSSLL